jgi:hypothetical protein
MSLDQFAITRKWPAKHSDRLQLYSLPTPNVKVSRFINVQRVLDAFLARPAVKTGLEIPRRIAA